MKEALLKKHPELEGILNKLAGKITETQMTQMNYQVGVDGKPAAQVARDFFGKRRVDEKLTNHSQVFALENFFNRKQFHIFSASFGFRRGDLLFKKTPLSLA